MVSTPNEPLFVVPSVSTSTPACHVSAAGRSPGRGGRVGEPRAVHVHAQSVLPRDRGEIRDLFHAVRSAGLGEVGQAERRRLECVHDADACLRQVLAQCGGRHPPMVSGEWNLAGAECEHLRRAALVRLDVRIPVTKDGAVGRHHRAEGDGIRRGARRHRERLERVVLEELAQSCQRACASTPRPRSWWRTRRWPAATASTNAGCTGEVFSEPKSRAWSVPRLDIVARSWIQSCKRKTGMRRPGPCVDEVDRHCSTDERCSLDGRAGDLGIDAGAFLDARPRRRHRAPTR